MSRGLGDVYKRQFQPLPCLVLLAFPADYQVVFLPGSGVCLPAAVAKEEFVHSGGEGAGGLQNKNGKTHLSFPFSG